MASKSNKKVIKTAADILKDSDTSTRSASSRISSRDEEELLFNKTNYMWVAGGFVVIFLGMILMMGGHMPSPDVWDDNIIYSFRRTVLAPFVILGGLVIGGIGIFKK